MGWVFPLHGDARTLCRVGDEARELVERPSSDQAVVFAGFRPTAGACRAPADTGESFQADDAHTLPLGMEDDLMGELMVHVAHPARLVALALAHGANLLRLLQLLAAGVELAALGALLTPIAQEAIALADHRHHGGHLHAQVYAHDALAGVGSGSGSLYARSAIHVPRLIRSTPGLPNGSLLLPRIAICCTCPS